MSEREKLARRQSFGAKGPNHCHQLDDSWIIWQSSKWLFWEMLGMCRGKCWGTFLHRVRSSSTENGKCWSLDGEEWHTSKVKRWSKSWPVSGSCLENPWRIHEGIQISPGSMGGPLQGNISLYFHILSAECSPPHPCFLPVTLGAWLSLPFDSCSCCFPGLIELSYMAHLSWSV